MTAEEKAELLRRVDEECEGPAGKFPLPLTLDIVSALALIGNLQLALRHPGNSGPSSEAAGRLIRGLILLMNRNGLPACAELARLGGNPDHDAYRGKP